LEACQDLFPYAKKIYILSRTEELTGDPVLVEEVLANEKIEAIYTASIKEIVGDKMVSGLKYEDTKTQKESILEVQGVFVEIGMVPNADIVKGLVKINDWGEVIIDHKTTETSAQGIFAAGDVVDAKFKQNNIAVGLGCIAALSAYEYIKTASSE